MKSMKTSSKKIKISRKKILFVIVAIVPMLIGYHFALNLMAGVPIEDGWEEKKESLENILNEENPSLNMMITHLNEISKERHTTNSEQIEKVREYLCNQFEIMGYEYEVVEDSYTGPELAVLDLQHCNGLSKEEAENERDRKSGGFKYYYSNHYKENYEEEEILPVKHLFVKVVPEDVSDEKAVLVMTHFDSVRSSCNTTDTGMSVAGVLEAMRLLRNKELKRPVYFWFSDGEEVSLLGAETILEDMPELKEHVDYVLNFSGYGPEGNQFLINVGENNSSMLEHFKCADTKVAAFSLLAKGVERCGTDEYQNVLKPAGFQGLDFAALVDSKEYHYTMHDSVENLDRKTANSALYNITTLVEYCATVDKSSVTADSDTLIFTLPFFTYITVPAKTLKCIHLIIIAVITILVLTLQKVTNKEKPATNPGEFLAYIGGGILTAGIIGYIIDLAALSEVSWSIRGYILVPITFIAFYVFAQILSWKTGSVGLFSATFILLAVTGIITTLLVPDISYLFVASFIVLNVVELLISYTKGIPRTVLVLMVLVPGSILISSLFATWQMIAYATVGVTLFGGLFMIMIVPYLVIYHGMEAIGPQEGLIEQD